MNSGSDGSTPVPGGGRLLADRYRLLEKIGEGGAAEVFRARDTRLDRIVAIKLLRPQYTNDQSSRIRFATEAKAAAGLSHPNIVDVYDFGEAPDGAMFIAMQYVEGQNLKDLLQKRGRMLPSEVISIAKQACHALAAAHEKGLIHRDVKPQNILIDTRGNVHLTDFGIVKALSAQSLTQTGMTFGTAAYISPEQATGSQVGPASDIYSLGCVMYEMLTGVPPFIGENPAVVAYKQVWEQPRPVHDLVPEVPPSLEGIVMRCLNKDPGRRYPNAEALASDLEAIGTSFNQPTQAVALGALGAMANADAHDGRWTPAVARPPAERSEPIPVQPVSANVPPVRAQTAAFNAPTRRVGTPRYATQTATAYTGHAAAPPVQVVNVPDRRRLGWLPLAIVALLGLLLLGFALLQSRGLFNGGVVAGGTPTPTQLALLPPGSPTAGATATLGSIVVGSPGVQPTQPPEATPAEMPTLTPAPPTDTPLPPTDTPAPPPTDISAPPPTDTPEAVVTASLPTPTPESGQPPTPTVEEQPPPPSGGITIDDNQFAGGYRNSSGLYHGVTATWVYGQGTSYNTMTARFKVNNQAVGDGSGNLTLVGVDSEDAAKNNILVTLNGVEIYTGPDPLPNDFATGPDGPGNWGVWTWSIPPGTLKPGQNTISIVDLDPSSCTNCPSFVMIDYAQVNTNK